MTDVDMTEMKEDNDCEICFTSSSNLAKCSYCDAKCCTTCLETYILSRKDEPACFQCKKPYSAYFIQQHTSKNFRSKKLRDHEKEIIWDREKSMMVQSQSLAAARLHEKRVKLFALYEEDARDFDVFMDKQLVAAIKYRKQLLDINDQMKSFEENDPGMKILKARAYNLMKIICFSEKFEFDKQCMKTVVEDVQNVVIDQATLLKEIDDLMERKAELFSFVIGETVRPLHKQVFTSGEVFNREEKKEEKKEAKFVRQCPKTECRGFCDHRGVCGICSTTICTRCWAETNPQVNHECKEEDLQTKTFITADSKSCPCCKVLIHRIEGCDHMFCTSCKTGFNWRTGSLIDNRHNTNPMMREWLRHNQRPDRQEEVNECAGDLSQQVMSLFNKLLRSPKNLTKFGDVHLLVCRLENCCTLLRSRNRRQQPVDLDSFNQELRVRYMIKEIDERNFKIQASKAVRDNHCTLELVQLYDMWFAALHELLNELIGVVASFTAFTDEYAAHFIQKANSLRDYYNNCLQSLVDRHYGSANHSSYKMNVLSSKYSLAGHSSVDTVPSGYHRGL